MFSHFFIERPIFASVLSIVITLAGAVAVVNLPVAQYPPITPPSIWVQCTYPGANAQDVADSVAAPVEQQVNGVEDMMYMVSQSNNDGTYQLTVTFKPGVNLNFAQVLVQNRINLALPLLPDVVKQAGVITRKRNPDILQVIAVYSPTGRYDQLYLSNFVTIKVKDEIARVEGVGDCQQFGQQDYSMRLWLDPEKLAVMGMTAMDVSKALREQNMQVAAGHIGQEPVPAGTRFDFPITTEGRLTTTEDFENIILRSDPSGRKVRLKDVGSAKLGAKNLDSTSMVNGRPNGSLAIFALPDANAIAVAQRVRAKMDELKKSFPEDIDYWVSLDMTPFMEESIHQVVRTLIEGIILVAIVVLVFLQNWRSALIPLVAVPVAVIGTFAVMAAIGFSLNNLTLFGLVLAIGIVVDDAIVVVEAVEHHIEEGMTPRQAAHKAMDEVSGPVVAVALVLSAVFVPCAFITGITGQFFRQFALTIAVSTVISAFNSLTLSPALAAILLQPRGAKKDVAGRFLDFILGWFFRLFNWSFRQTTTAYTRIVGQALWGSAVVLMIYGGLLGLTWWTSSQLPTGYIPNQDQGRFYIAVQLPDAASLERTQKVVDEITRRVTPPRYKLDDESLEELRRDHVPAAVLAKLDELHDRWFKTKEAFLEKVAELLPAEELEEYKTKLLHGVQKGTEGVFYTTGIAGQSFTLNANGSNFAQFFISFVGFEKRQDPSMSATAIVDRVREMLKEKLPEAKVSLFTPPPVSGLGSASGFKIIVEDRGDLGLTELQKQTERLMAAANGGRFKLGEQSFAALRQKNESEVVLSALDGLKNKEYLTKELFEKAVAAALSEAGVRGQPEQERIIAAAVGAAENRKVVGKLFSVFRANTPQLFIKLDRDQCQTMGVNPADVFSTLQIYLGSYYVNDFNRFGRTWQVVVQAHGDIRDKREKIKLLAVRNSRNEMVPLGAVLTVEERGGPINIGRYNMYPAAAILGATEKGVSTGQGIEEMEELCREILPPGMAFEWTEINYMQIDAAKNIWNNLIFPLAVVFVFLVLAAQYESWALPLAVILVVPMCILGSLTGVAVTKGDINIFTQIGFVVLVGLASKNAILIVEFAKHKREEGGLPRREATLEACKLRLRPILMTSFAFILGVVPLILGHGIGAEMRRVLGIAVFSGMLGVTIFGIFLTPVFFYVIEGLAEAPLFSTERARRVGKVLMWGVGVLTLGAPWLLPLLLGQRRKRLLQPVGTPGRNGVPHEPAALLVNGHGKPAHGELALTDVPGAAGTTTNGHGANSNGDDGAHNRVHTKEE